VPEELFMTIRKLALMLAIACVALVPGCARADATKQTAVGFYLDTVITLTAYVEDVGVLNEALQFCGACEQLCPVRPVSAITVNGRFEHLEA
jgi:hypothetical protein